MLTLENEQSIFSSSWSEESLMSGIKSIQRFILSEIRCFQLSDQMLLTQEEHLI